MYILTDVANFFVCVVCFVCVIFSNTFDVLNVINRLFVCFVRGKSVRSRAF